MGAGRLFALTLVLAAAPAAAAGSALGQASTVGPWAALEQGAGLELRDAENQPISREALAGELKSAAREEAQAAASASSRLWSDFVERAGGLASALRTERPARDGASAVAAPARRQPKTHLVVVLTRRAAPDAGSPRPAAGPAPAASPDRARVLPLRL